MTSPAANAFSALVATVGFLFIGWHTWHYDHWRCLLFSKQDWFRALMCHILIASVGLFVASTWMQTHVAYAEYYVQLGVQTIPAPWQLWTTAHQHVYKHAVYILCAGWCFLQAVHLEEFLYWGYLIQSIRTAGGPKTAWLQSGYFKLWVIASTCATALLFGAVSIETENLDMMRAYLFVVGSVMSCVLGAASVILCLVFPRFVESVARQGATFEILERLHFFQEMNETRTVFRLIYCVCFLAASADAFTHEKRINVSAFWSDLLFLSGQLSLFSATCLSVVILLPRNMTSESVPSPNDNTFHPMVPYKRPLPLQDSQDSHRHLYELGNRLNIDREALATGLHMPNTPNDKEAYEMHGTGEGDGEGDDAPFKAVADMNRRARYSEFPTLPQVVQKFKSPFETGERKVEGPTQVLVTTSHTVHHDE